MGVKRGARGGLEGADGKVLYVRVSSRMAFEIAELADWEGGAPECTSVIGCDDPRRWRGETRKGRDWWGAAGDKGGMRDEGVAAFKRCVCGHEIGTEDDWRSCPYVGVQSRRNASALELRNCPECSSTLAVELSDARR